MKIKTSGIIMAVAAGWMAVQLVSASPIYVDLNATGANDGTSWTDAYVNLQTAIDAADPGEALWVAEGTYINDIDGVNSFSISNSLTIYGGFTNVMETLEERDPVEYPTILDGEDARRVLNIDIGEGGSVILDGLSFENGSLSEHGIGINKAGHGAVEMLNCTIAGNEGSGHHRSGHGAYFQNGSLTILNTAIINNEQVSGDRNRGLGLYVLNTDLVMGDCIITNNTSPLGISSKGGGLFINGGTFTITNTLFAYNQVVSGYRDSFSDGAAALITGSAVGTFRNCEFRDNSHRTGSQVHGGTVNVRDGSIVTVDLCTFAYNAPGEQGGAFKVDGGDLTVRNSILWNNSATMDGNEIYVVSGSVSVDYSIVTGTGAGYIDGPGISLLNISTNDPRFASATDLRLKSTAGRWDSDEGTEGDWVNDAVTSYAIDEGDPASDFSNEPAGSIRVNLGRYGNTWQASKSPVAEAPTVVDVDAVVDYNSAILKGQLISGDLSDIMVYYGTNETDLASQSSLTLYPRREPDSVFSTRVTGLLPETTYYYAWYATNAAGESWSATNDFFSGSAGSAGPDTVIHVDLNAVGAGTGRTWFDAFTSLQTAIDAAEGTTNEIWVAAGNYMEGAPIAIEKEVEIYGGFAGGGDGETERDSRDIAANPTILDANSAHRVMVLNIDAETTVILDGLSFENGLLSGGDGAGIYKTGHGAVEMLNCTIAGNRVTAGHGNNGQGAYFSAGSLTILNTAIINNEYRGLSRGRGIGLYLLNTDLVMGDCIVTNNTTANVQSSGGGGLYINGGTFTITNSLFAYNQILAGTTHDWMGMGAAVLITGSADGTFRNCVFRHHSFAGSNEDSGGTIMLGNSGNVLVDLCTFAHNEPGEYGGAIKIDNGDLTVRNSILWNNTATVEGDEIYVAAGTASVEWSCLTDTDEPTVVGATVSNSHTNNPLFASATDLRLRSFAGRWDPVAGDWVIDEGQLSPCINAGDPESDFSNEPEGSTRVNQGAYGNTPQASKAPPPIAPLVETREPYVDHTLVDLKGELTDGTQSDVYFYYGTNSATLSQQTPIMVVPSPNTGTVFSVRVTGLRPETTYYFTCFATNPGGDAWSDTNSFVSGTAGSAGPLTVIHVDRNAYGANTGRTWFDAFTSVQSGIDAAAGTTNEIWIAGNTYRRGAQIAIDKEVEIYGGFAGGPAGETARTDRDIAAHPVVFDGNKAHRVLTIDIGEGTTVILDGLKFENGWHSDQGPGINKTGAGSVKMFNCTIAGNKGDGWSQLGYGGYFEGGSLTITNTAIINHEQTAWDRHRGLGLYIKDTTLVMGDCIITNNTAPGGTSSAGGGLFIDGGTFTITNTLFAHNQIVTGTGHSEVGTGAAVLITGSADGTFRNCVFRHNSVRVNVEDYVHGGTITLDGGGSVTVDLCTFAHNTAGRYGGAVMVDGGDLTVLNSILWNNTATVAGDEFFATNDTSAVTVSYSLITSTNTPYVVMEEGTVITFADGILVGQDPLFASETDLHLRSRMGRWDPVAEIWVSDAVDSPAIDAGDPLDTGWQNEPAPNGGRINLGAYGGTPYASKTWIDRGSLFIIR